MIMVTDDTLDGASENKIHHLKIMNRPYSTNSTHIMGDYAATPKKAEQILADKANMIDGGEAVINISIKKVPKKFQELPTDKYVAYGDSIVFQD